MDRILQMNAIEDPSSPARTERRRWPRWRARHAVVLTWSEGDATHRERTFTITVSRFGCSLHSFRAIRPGTRVEIEREGETRAGRVIYALMDHSKKMAEVGISLETDADLLWTDSTL